MLCIIIRDIPTVGYAMVVVDVVRVNYKVKVKVKFSAHATVEAEWHFLATRCIPD